MNNFDVLIFASVLKSLGITAELFWRALWANPWIGILVFVLIAVAVLGKQRRRRY